MPIDGINGKYPPGVLAFPPDNGNNGNGNSSSGASLKTQNTSEGFQRTSDFLEIRKAVDSQPDVRLDKVNRLAKAIDEGTYNVSGRKIADAMIRKHMVDFSV